MPVWAANVDYIPGSPIGIIRTFDGSEGLEDKDITLQAIILSAAQVGATAELFFDADVSDAVKENGIWLPVAGVTDLAPAGNPEARSLPQTNVQNSLRDFLIFADDAEIEAGAEIEFILKVGGLYCVDFSVDESTNELSMAPWRFSIKEILSQRSGVTILNNVIDPTKGEKTAVRYELENDGIVTVAVFNLAGDLVNVLHRGRQSAGSHTLTWDGTNSGGRIVARGIYFIRVVSRGVDEYRKVIIQKER